MPKLLYFVEKTHPILREIMPEINNFTDPLLHEMIENMSYSILPAQIEKATGYARIAAGMAANQWGIKKRIFIFTPDGSEAGKTLEVMINPSYIPYLRPSETSPALTADYEGCFSIPLTAGIINRYESITATYYNLAGEKITDIMEGWRARVFQHETDHLNGRLYDGVLDHYPGPECIECFFFKNPEEMQDFWINTVRPSRKQKEQK